jgi:hypothetical protein
MQRENLLKPLVNIVPLSVCLTATAKETPTVKPKSVGMSAERLERVTQMNRSYTDTRRISGVVTAVVREGKIVCQSASRLKRRNRPKTDFDRRSFSNPLND